ncbi:aggregation-promoting factor C-terminal-like domain-containing protein [Microbacterium aureliae]
MTPGDEILPTRRAARRRSTDIAVVSPRRPAVPVAQPRWSRRRGVLGGFAAFAVVGFAAAYVGPTGVALSQASAEERPPISLYASSMADIQTRVVAVDAEPLEADDLDRGGYAVYVKPKPTPTPEPEPVVQAEAATQPQAPAAVWTPPFVTPDPGSAQAIAYDMVKARGWGDDEFSCLVALWNKESGWRVNAYNASSGAYGIPQSLPGSKMATAGADWETNPATQITWGLGYISGRYGAPCGAWAHSQSVGWY